MGRDRLLTDNQDLRHQLQALQAMFGRCRVAAELTPYRGWLERFCHGLRSGVLDNIARLRSYDDAVLPQVLPDLREETRRLRDLFEVINGQYAAVLTRATVEDRLVLLALRWLHDSTAPTRTLAFGLTDGDIAVRPTTQSPPVYLMPVSRQRTLLYLPLVFHEYGHTLYAVHADAMRKQVAKFEQLVANALLPSDPIPNSDQVEFVQQLAAAWVNWLQELFCDAVGLAIGGPAYLSAYDHYFRLRWRDDADLTEDEMADVARTHPHTWLRTRLLLSRALRGDRPGLEEVATGVRDAWDADLADHGAAVPLYRTWDDGWEAGLHEVIDQMIAVAGPRPFDPAEIALDPDAQLTNPIALVNAAWRMHDGWPTQYRGWERRAVRRYLQSH